MLDHINVDFVPKVLSFMDKSFSVNDRVIVCLNTKIKVFVLLTFHSFFKKIFFYFVPMS